jgi:hypothetical protein
MLTTVTEHVVLLLRIARLTSLRRLPAQSSTVAFGRQCHWSEGILHLKNIPNSPMESYLREAFNELFAEDGLTVVARGLGVNNLYSKFAQYYANRDHGRKLVFCINCTGVEDQLQDLFLTSSDAGIKDLPQVGGIPYCM